MASAPSTDPTIPVGPAMGLPVTPLTATAIPVVPPTSTPASAPPDQSQTKKIGLIVAAAVVALAVIGGVVYFVSSGSSADATPTSSAARRPPRYRAVATPNCAPTRCPVNGQHARPELRSNPSINSYSFRNMSVGKVTQSGNKAVVWLTGQICKSGRCDSLPTGSTSGQSFATVYNNAVNGNSRSTLALALLEQGGKWYSGCPWLALPLETLETPETLGKLGTLGKLAAPDPQAPPGTPA